MKYKILSILILLTPIYPNSIYTPDYYTKEGNCVVISSYKKFLGLIPFRTVEEFKNACRGKMFFKYKKNKCRWFTMKDMKFNILISSNHSKKYILKIGEKREMCTNIVVEEIVK